jgi:hypothetical protein
MAHLGGTCVTGLTQAAKGLHTLPDRVSSYVNAAGIAP